MITRPVLVDTHAHLDDPAYDEDRAEVLQRARAAGVEAIINPGSDLEGSRAAVAYAHKTDNVFAAVGLHPHALPQKSGANENGAQASGNKSLTPEELEKAYIEIDQLAADPVVVALGEFGLDLKYEGSDLKVQRNAFIRQVQLAKKHSLPIILHCRSVYDELEKLLRKEAAGVPGVVHCFAGNPQQLKQLTDLGFYIAYGGIVTFAKKTEELREAVKQTPADRILLETDAPYLTPVPRRGKRNEPAEIATIGQFIADLRQISYAELAEITTNNAKRVFALPDAFEVHDHTA